MPDIHWVKLSTAMFKDEKIMVIQSMPSGSEICLIWIKLIVLAGSVNDNGCIYLTRDIPYTDDMLARVFGLPVEMVRVALHVFEQFKMIEVMQDQKIFLVNWGKHQNVDGMERTRELTRIRVQRSRERSKLLTEATKTSPGNVTVTLRNALDSDSDSDSDSEEEKSAKASPTKQETEPDPIPYEEIIGCLNEETGHSYEWAGARGEKNRELIRHLWKRGFRGPDFAKVIEHQVRAWNHAPKHGQRDMRPYLRPATLFQASKFESYLNGGPNG